jgi:hypothetical protein
MKKDKTELKDVKITLTGDYPFWGSFGSYNVETKHITKLYLYIKQDSEDDGTVAV